MLGLPAEKVLLIFCKIGSDGECCSPNQPIHSKSKAMALDRIDVALLNALQRDCRQTVQQLAEQVGLSATPCWKRVKALEEAGVIRGYSALVDRERVGLAQCVIAEITLNRHGEDVVAQFERAVVDCEAIVSCDATTGAADYVVKVLVPDIRAYDQFLHATAFKLPGVTHVRSSVVLRELKAQTRLPIAWPDAAGPLAGGGAPGAGLAGRAGGQPGSSAGTSAVRRRRAAAPAVASSSA